MENGQKVKWILSIRLSEFWVWIVNSEYECMWERGREELTDSGHCWV